MKELGFPPVVESQRRGSSYTLLAFSMQSTGSQRPHFRVAAPNSGPFSKPPLHHPSNGLKPQEPLTVVHPRKRICIIRLSESRLVLCFTTLSCNRLIASFGQPKR